MNEYSIIKDRNGNFSGFWIREPEHAQDNGILVALFMKENLPTDILKHSYRIIPNNVDDKGGVFVIFSEKAQDDQHKITDKLDEITNEVNLYIKNAKEFSEKGLGEPAIAELEKAIELFPSNAVVNYELALAYMRFAQEEHTNEIIDMLKKAVDLDYNLTDAHWLRGQIYATVDVTIDTAIEELLIVVQQKPDHADAHCKLGDVFWKKSTLISGNSKKIYFVGKALNHYQEAIKLNPNHTVANCNYGWLMLRAAKTEADYSFAEEFFLTTLKNEPFNANANFYMGYICFERRNWEEAVRYLTIALRSDPSHSGAKKLLQDANNKIGGPPQKKWWQFWK